MPCEPWPVTPCCEFPEGVDGVNAVAAATEVCWVLSGRRFGFCTVKVRPCADDHPRTYLDRFAPVVLDPLWFHHQCGCGQPGCDCDVPEIDLPGPVASVTEVKIGGAVLDPAAYRVDEAHLLVRLDGLRWPSRQDLTLPSSEPFTFEVTYRRGRAIPALGLLAAGELACEIAKGCAGDDDCALPQRVTSITRDGVTMTLLDPQEFLDNGRVGIYTVDLFLRVYNPHRAARPPGIYRADQPKMRRVR